MWDRENRNRSCSSLRAIPSNGLRRAAGVPEDEEIVDAALIEARDFDATIERFFRSVDVAFLHVRYPAYGCFSCRIDRSDSAVAIE